MRRTPNGNVPIVSLSLASDSTWGWVGKVKNPCLTMGFIGGFGDNSFLFQPNQPYLTILERIEIRECLFCCPEFPEESEHVNATKT